MKKNMNEERQKFKKTKANRKRNKRYIKKI